MKVKKFLKSLEDEIRMTAKAREPYRTRRAFACWANAEIYHVPRDQGELSRANSIKKKEKKTEKRKKYPYTCERPASCSRFLNFNDKCKLFARQLKMYKRECYTLLCYYFATYTRAHSLLCQSRG